MFKCKYLYCEDGVNFMHAVQNLKITMGFENTYILLWRDDFDICIIKAPIAMVSITVVLHDTNFIGWYTHKPIKYEQLQIPKLKYFSSRLVVFFVKSIGARY